MMGLSSSRTIPPFSENPINSFIWCAVGGAIGWLAAMLMKSEGRIGMIESMLVGVFGAFIGGDFIVTLMNKGVVNDKDFRIGSLAFAVVGAVVMLIILKLLRRSVGPLQAGKKKPRARP
jgi:uncharacterized membrane protein YeaQ/YmgE (transglycosylase-associated protein family)